jgi:hypothetical protein
VYRCNGELRLNFYYSPNADGLIERWQILGKKWAPLCMWLVECLLKM